MNRGFCPHSLPPGNCSVCNPPQMKRGSYIAPTQGCICPPGSERTCRGPMCPRQPIPAAT